MRSFDDPDWDDYEPPVDLPALQVEPVDHQPIGVLLGPDGEPLHTVMPATWVPFGYTR